jgi:hypothetical protein
VERRLAAFTRVDIHALVRFGLTKRVISTLSIAEGEKSCFLINWIIQDSYRWSE